MKPLAKEIVEYRARHNISLREMAERCKLSLQTVYSIEAGIQDPSRLTEAKIRLVLDADRKEE